MYAIGVDMSRHIASSQTRLSQPTYLEDSSIRTVPYYERAHSVCIRQRVVQCDVQSV
jgi:hypothetical protein